MQASRLFAEYWQDQVNSAKRLWKALKMDDIEVSKDNKNFLILLNCCILCAGDEALVQRFISEQSMRIFLTSSPTWKKGRGGKNDVDIRCICKRSHSGTYSATLVTPFLPVHLTRSPWFLLFPCRVFLLPLLYARLLSWCPISICIARSSAINISSWPLLYPRTCCRAPSVNLLSACASW